MKNTALCLAVLPLLLAGCVSSPTAPDNQGTGNGDKGLALKKEYATSAPRRGSVGEPAAVIRFASDDYRLSRDMDALLTRVARDAQGSDQTMIRLEGYGPEGGSSALTLSQMDRPMQVVKARLVELKVPAKRIVLAPFGDEHRVLRDKQRPWVEIYLVSGQGR